MSFPLAIIASLNGYGCFACASYRATALAGYVAPACNYAYVALVLKPYDLGVTFMLYLVLGTLYWAAAALVSTRVETAPKLPSGGDYQKVPEGRGVL